MVTESDRANHSKRFCSPNCQFFKCSKRAMGPNKIIKGRTRISCNFVDGDLCTGSRCTYSFCVKHKLKTDGTCGLTERPKEVDDDTIESTYEREIIEQEKQATNYQNYLKDKYRRKLNPKIKKR